jgi:protein SCO1/2
MRTALLLVFLLLACRGERPAEDPALDGVVRGPSGFYGSTLPEPRPAPPMRLVEHGGRVFDLAGQRGKVVLLFFGYTHCPDVCPTTLADWRRVKGTLGGDTARVRFVFVSTDPARDTPEAARAYVTKFDSSFYGLSGDSATIAGLERAFMVRSFREAAATDSAGAAVADAHAGHEAYSVAHSTRTFVIDEAGRWRLIMPAGAGPAMIAADVRKLLSE